MQERQQSAEQVLGTAKMSLVVATGLVSVYNLMPPCSDASRPPPLCYSEAIGAIVNKGLEAAASAVESAERVFAASNTDDGGRLKAANVAQAVIAGGCCGDTSWPGSHGVVGPSEHALLPIEIVPSPLRAGNIGRANPLSPVVRGNMEHKKGRRLREPGEGVATPGKSAIELVANRMVETIDNMTNGRTGHWRMLVEVADRLKVGEAVADQAGAFAVKKGWIEEAVHSVRLTNAGRERVS